MRLVTIAVALFSNYVPLGMRHYVDLTHNTSVSPGAFSKDIWQFINKTRQ